MQLSAESRLQVAAEDAGQSRDLLPDGPLGCPPLVKPSDRELVALPRPCPADDTADGDQVGLAGDGVPSRLRGDVDVPVSYTHLTLPTKA